jgi:hypothetical protein
MVAARSATSAASTSHTFSVPGGAATGDILESWLVYPDTVNPTVPTGWTFAFSLLAAGGGEKVYAAWRVHDGSATYTWTLDASAAVSEMLVYSTVGATGTIRSSTTYSSSTFGVNDQTGTTSTDGVCYVLVRNNVGTAALSDTAGFLTSLASVTFGGVSVSALGRDSTAGAVDFILNGTDFGLDGEFVDLSRGAPPPATGRWRVGRVGW